ncbi:MAG: hypothetical protein KF887_02135 [Paracoccaceae bacterium]|nr:MAG: hypothetical protein KF887_02135 [Paracoccaceae bacterium]
MLHILAQVMMIATRQLPPPALHGQDRSIRDDENRRKAWSMLGGIRF